MTSDSGEPPLTYHGGNLSAARESFPDAPEPWIDLSTGINGHSYPVGALEPATFERLPEPSEIAALEAVAARAYGCRPEAVVAAPGTQALIQWLPRLFPARRVGILGLTYAEHDRTWRRAGATVETVDDADALAAFDVAVVVNPNNPDGRLLPPASLRGIGAGLADGGGLLVVDEAFMDVMPVGTSLATGLPASRTVVLRSFGKVFGLAGLRLGFALASPDLAPAIRDALGPWAIGGPAIAIGCRALADADWLRETRLRLAAEAARLDTLLAQSGSVVVGGTPLFRLACFAVERNTFERLARAGILARPFAGRPGLLRFGIPSAGQHWDRLARALSAE